MTLVFYKPEGPVDAMLLGMDDASDKKQLSDKIPEAAFEQKPSVPSGQKRFVAGKIMIIVIVVLALAGSGWYLWQRQKPASPPATNTFQKTGYDDACRLVSKADVEAAFGSKFEEFTKDGTTQAGLNRDNSSCTINEVHEKTAKGANEFTSLQIAVDNFESEDVAKHKLDVMRRSVVIDGKLLDVITDVPGIGDEAFFSKNQVFGSTQEYLFVRKGARLFHFIAVKFNGIDSEKVRPQIIKIARQATE